MHKTAALAVGLNAVTVISLIAVHLVRTDLDPVTTMISLYALDGWGWIMTLSFVAWGLSAWVLAAALRRHCSTLLGKIGLGFLVLGGAGPLLAAIFPTDRLGAPVTSVGEFHALGAMLGDGIAVAAVLVTLHLIRKPAWRRYRAALIAAAMVATAAAVWLTMALGAYLTPDHQFVPGAPIGVPNRVLIVSYLTWQAVAGTAAYRVARRAEAAEADACEPDARVPVS